MELPRKVCRAESRTDLPEFEVVISLSVVAYRQPGQFLSSCSPCRLYIRRNTVYIRSSKS